MKFSAIFDSVLTGHPINETETLGLGGHAEYFTTVIGLGSINRDSIFTMSKSREEAGVSVPYRVSDSIDASLEEQSLWLSYGIPGR